MTASSSSSSLALGRHFYLPYPQAACRKIEHHLNALAAAFPSSFDATLSPFTHDDGRDVVLVNATAALADGAEVSVWLVEAYPHIPPLVFMPLPCTDTERPAYVDGSGVVTAPYLQHWRWPESDLVGLLQSLQSLVSMHPPTAMPRGPIGHVDDDSTFQDTACVASTMVSSRSQEIQMRLQALQEDKDRLEQELQMVTFNAGLLEGTSAAGSCHDHETEDAMEELDRALRAGRIPLCQYLKAIKDVARAQFLNWPVPSELLVRPE